MPTGLRHALPAAAAVLLIALVAPGVAIAGGGGNCSASACKVYSEQGVPSAGVHQQPPAGPSTSGATQTPTNLSRLLAQAGKDKGPLSHLLTDSGLGTAQSGPGNVVAPSALGAIFDLGPGPTALFAILLAAVLGFGVHAGVRGRLRRRSSA